MSKLSDLKDALANTIKMRDAKEAEFEEASCVFVQLEGELDDLEILVDTAESDLLEYEEQQREEEDDLC